MVFHYVHTVCLMYIFHLKIILTTFVTFVQNSIHFFTMCATVFNNLVKDIDLAWRLQLRAHLYVYVIYHIYIANLILYKRPDALVVVVVATCLAFRPPDLLDLFNIIQYIYNYICVYIWSRVQQTYVSLDLECAGVHYYIVVSLI